MNKFKNINFIFVLSLILCVGVISFIAFGTNEKEGIAIKTEDISETTVAATIKWYKAGPEMYELNSEYSAYENTSVTTTKTSAKKTSKKSVSKSKRKKTKTTTTSATSKKIKSKKKSTAKTTTVKKAKKLVRTTVTSVTTTTTKKKKKKKKKTVSVQTTTTTTATKAYTPQTADSKTYQTRDISKETYTIKSITTGKKVKSNGFDIACQIVNGEMGSSWNEEAIKAQAVAAYTYLRYCKENGKTAVLAAKSGYDSRLKEIVKSVEGLTCTYNGSVINAVFCASSAGCTADSANVWGESLPYLKSVDSKYDSAYDPNYGVTKTISKADVKKILQKQGVTLSTKKKNWIKVTSNYNGKYVRNVSIDGQLNLTGAKICSLMGLKSSAFTVSYSNGNFTFTTYGYGHGVGMSQWGAQLYASKGGYKFDQILKHYYSGISISL